MQSYREICIKKLTKLPETRRKAVGINSANQFSHMNKAIGLALLVAGIVLVVYGVDASNSVSSNISRTFSGSPTNKTMWLLIGGIVASIVGAALTFTSSSRIQK